MPSDSKAIVPTIKKARDAGLLVIVLDTPLDPIDAADATFATDNFKAGDADRRSGPRRRSATRRRTPRSPSSTSPSNQPTVDYLRDQGFMKGFGIDVKDPNHYGDENDPRIVGHEVRPGRPRRGAARRWRTCCRSDPDVNVVYTINEPTAAGAYEALKAAGKDEGSVLIVSVDGGCPGVKNVEAGVIGATSQQYPLLMASMALEAMPSSPRPARSRRSTPGLDFFDTGATLITDKPVDGVAVDHGRGRPEALLGLIRLRPAEPRLLKQRGERPATVALLGRRATASGA